MIHKYAVGGYIGKIDYIANEVENKIDNIIMEEIDEEGQKWGEQK